MSELGRQAVAGVFSSGGIQAARMALQLISVMILTRMLGPDDFGVIAVVMAVVGIGELVRDFGLSSAAIQRPTLPLPVASNLFWLNAALGLAMMALVMLAGPLLARLLDDPRLTSVTLGLAPIFFLSGLTAQHRVTLVRDLRFGTLGLLEMIGQLAGLLAAVAVALLVHNYYALIAQGLAAGVVTCVTICVAAGWRPALPARGRGTLSMMRFAGAMLGSSMLTYVSMNIDTLVVGHQLGTTQAGVYNRGTQLVRTPLRQLLRPFSTVLFPVMARAQDDSRRLEILARRAQLFSSAPVVGAAAVVVAAPDAVVRVVLGPGWAAAAPISTFLAIAVGVGTLASVGATILTAQGLGGSLLRLGLVTATLDIILVVIGVRWGAPGVAAGLAVSASVGFFLSLWWVARSASISAKPLVWQGLALVGGGAVGVLIARVLGASVAHSPGAQVALALATVALGMCLLLLHPLIRRDLVATWDMLRRR